MVKPFRKLKALRVEYGYQQKELAQKLGISLPTYSFKENGKSEFTLSEAFMIARLFKKPLEEIFQR